METRARDAIWIEGELIDRSFAFVYKGGHLVGASEQFGTTTGAPPRPLQDAQAAIDSLAANAVCFPRAIAEGAIHYPYINVQVTNWVFPHVIAYEVNYVTTDRRLLDGDKPVRQVGIDRWNGIKAQLQSGLPTWYGDEGGFQQARFMQTFFTANLENNQLVEVREYAFGTRPDLVYEPKEAAWADMVAGTLNPLPDWIAGRFGGDGFVSFRVLRHGTMGHAGMFIRPANRIGTGGAR